MNWKEGLKQGTIYFIVFWFGLTFISGGVSGVIERWTGEILNRDQLFSIVLILSVFISFITFLFYGLKKQKDK